MKTNLLLITTLGLFLATGPTLTAQQFELLGGTVNGVSVNTFAAVTRNVKGPPCDPRRPGAAVTDWVNSTTNPPLGGFLQNIPNLADPNQSWDLFYQHNLTARADGFRRVSSLGGTCDCFIFSSHTHETISQGMSFIGSYVEPGGALFAQWRNHSESVTHNTDHSGRGNADSINNFTIDFRVIGLPPGTPITVYHRYNTTALGWTKHENGGEDAILLRLGSLTLAGTSLIPPGTNPNAHALYNIDGQSNLLAGQAYTLAFSAETRAKIAARHAKSGGGCIDTFKDLAWSQFMGKIVLDFNPPVDPLPGSPAAANCNYALAWSVDTGSAKEFSSGGTLDPGDLYPQGYSGGFLTSYYRNDAAWSGGIDPSPDPATPGSEAPVATGIPFALARDTFFNLDGAAFLGFDLRTQTFGPGQPPITRDSLIASGANIAGILPPEYMLISYADNGERPYTVSPPGGAPTNSIGTGGPRGTTPAKDEVLQIEVLPYTGSSSVIDPQFSEFELDAALDPSPDFALSDNDDVNALATIRDEPAFAGAADFLYLTVSTESRFGFDSGLVYVPDSGSTGPLTPVIRHADLGIPPGTDLNALEFTWLNDPGTGETSLALLFSVARDVRDTPEDETGGLAPEQVYASFLNGSNFPFAGIIGDTDIDAITLIPCRAGSAPAIATNSLPNARVCSRYSQYLLGTGGFGSVYQWAVTAGSLPPGFSLDIDSGEISGTAASAGSYLFTVTLQSPGFPSVDKNFTLTVDPQPGPLGIVTTSPTAGNLGAWYVESIDVENACEPVTFRISGGLLPEGLMLDAVAGLITGLPTKDGIFPFDLTVRDSAGNEATASLSIPIFGPSPAEIRLNPAVFPTVNAGDPVALTLAATGGTPPYAFSPAGPLPPGYTLVGDFLSGTANGPNTLTAIDLQITDAQFRSADDTLYFAVGPNPPPGGPQLALPPSLDWSVGQTVLVQPTVSGGLPPYQFQLAHGAPPTGLGINPATGELTGTATYPESGILPWQVTDSNGLSGFTLVPYTIWPSFPGGYPAWKAFHGVASDTESTDGDIYQAMVEYSFGINPNQRDLPGLFRLERAPLGTWRVAFPSAGVPDVRTFLQRYDSTGNQWLPLQSNPFDPAGSPREMIRLRTEH